MRRRTTAISAGALTLALSGGTVLLVTTPATAFSASVMKCDRGGGASSSLTGDVCHLLGGVTAPVDALTGGLGPLTATVGERAGDKPGPTAGTAGDKPDHKSDPITDTDGEPTGGEPDPVTDQVGDKVDAVTDQVEELADDTQKKLDKVAKKAGKGRRNNDGRASSSPSPTASPRSTSPGGRGEASGDSSYGDLLGLPIDARCLPLIAPPDCGRGASSPAPSSSAGPDRSTPTTAPDGPASSDLPGGQAPAPPAVRPVKPQENGDTNGVDLGDLEQRATAYTPYAIPPSTDVETPPLTPLWPGQPLPTLTDRLGAAKLVPHRPQDLVGTVLTAVLLASAILATRIVQARKKDSTPQSMPFEGLRRNDSGRHRLA
ncbi:hypothetical protein GCM10022226_50220 [Sphaerisporangium flaviroseum]|uniref:Uncharacterized protein n=1 Tax=Sphaerisporangium flaviroseum TaxID=509199 RepID=A0ABP7IPT9_9ACTN